MDLAWTEEQDLLRETIRSLLAKYSSSEIVRELEDDPVGYRLDLWEELGRQGLLGLTIPEELGGSGMTALEQVILYEEFGRALTASPHLVSCVLAPRMLQGNADWLPGIASGEAIVSVAWLEPDGGEGPEGIQLRANGDRLSGEKIRVAFATSATLLITLARTDDGIGLFLADPSDTEATQVRVMGSDAEYLVRFDDTPAERIN